MQREAAVTDLNALLGWVTVSFSMPLRLPLTAPYFSATGVRPLVCRGGAQQRYGTSAAFIYWQFHTAFITYTTPANTQHSAKPDEVASAA